MAQRQESFSHPEKSGIMWPYSMKKDRRLLTKRIGIVIVILGLLFAGAVLGISAGTAFACKGDIAATLDSRTDAFTDEEIQTFQNLDPQCIMVLGAGVYEDGTPSPMLKDRLDTGVALYKAKAAPKLLLTGDNGQVAYNEVEPMFDYVVAQGVPEEDIFLDHAGFSTYDSIYRAKAIFQVDRAIVVTQTYHLYRALYGCRKMEIQALGAGADQQAYAGRSMREFREVLARDKDRVKWMIKPNPRYLGEAIPIDGDGKVTQ